MKRTRQLGGTSASGTIGQEGEAPGKRLAVTTLQECANRARSK